MARSDIKEEQEDRRKGTRDSIIAEIAKSTDANMKMSLMLLLNVLEEIGGKIDAVLNDERSLRETVLNGHEPVHHKHHEWIAGKMKAEEDEAMDMKANIRIVIEAVLRQGVTIAISAVAGMAAAAWYLR